MECFLSNVTIRKVCICDARQVCVADIRVLLEGMILKRTRLLLATLATFGIAVSLGAEAPAASKNVAVCIDSSSPTATIDRRVVAAVARSVGSAPPSYEFDGSRGVSDRFFRFLMRNQCGLIMGFPVDFRNADAPRGLALTPGYFETGYVLVGLGHALTVAAIPRNASVAVGLGTVPNFYLVGALSDAPPPLKAEGFSTQDEALDALVKHQVAAAMLWEPSVRNYRRHHHDSLVISKLPIDHARWRLAALFDPLKPQLAKTFERGLASLKSSGELATITNSPEGKYIP